MRYAHAMNTAAKCRPPHPFSRAAMSTPVGQDVLAALLRAHLLPQLL